MRRLLPFYGAMVGWLLSALAGATEVRIVGSANATAPLVSAQAGLQTVGVAAQFVGNGTSTAAIETVANEQADVAMTVRPLTALERASAPQAQLTQTRVAQQVVVPLVGPKIWAAGVRALSAAQAKEIYEGRIKNWREVGGPDEPIYFYTPAQGRGVWETFAGWIYGDLRRAPLGDQYESVNGRSDAAKAVASDPGALTYGFLSWADQQELYPLAVKLEDGTLVEASLENALHKGYPLSRPLYLVTPAPPFGATRQILNYLQTEAGRKALAESEFLAVDPSEMRSE